jgi:cobalt/nickel transport system ATP-binding protein
MSADAQDAALHSTAAVLRVRGLSFGYDASNGRLLDNFSIEIAPGERVGLVGPNGCGKTTLLRLLMGLERANGGGIEVLGHACRTEADFVLSRRQMGLVFQDSDDQLFCPTVHEDVAFGPFNLGLKHAEVHQVVRETLDLLGLKHLEQSVTYRLSAGQKRMVALATVLAMKPRILLLDEPTTGLDEKYRARLTDVLLKLPQEMLIVSHDDDFLAAVTTRVIPLGA